MGEGTCLPRMRAASPPNAPVSSALTGSMRSGSTRSAPDVTAHYYVAPYDTSDLLRTGADVLALTGARHELSGMKTSLIDAYILPDDLIKFAPDWILEPAPPERANVILREVSTLPRVLRLHVAADALHAYEAGAAGESARKQPSAVLSELCSS